MEAVLSRANAVQYRVVHAPSVAVRSKPWGRKVGLKLCGTLVKSDMRTVGGQADGWVRLADERFGEEEGWMLMGRKCVNTVEQHDLRISPQRSGIVTS